MLEDEKCNGKVKYPTHSKARHMAKHINRHDDKARLSEYKCKTCGRWHIGNAKRRERWTKAN